MKENLIFTSGNRFILLVDFFYEFIVFLNNDSSFQFQGRSQFSTFNCEVFWNDFELLDSLSLRTCSFVCFDDSIKNVFFDNLIILSLCYSFGSGSKGFKNLLTFCFEFIGVWVAVFGLIGFRGRLALKIRVLGGMY